MQTLRDYQTKAVAGIYDKWRGGDQGVLLVLPTGTGKTTVSAQITNHLQGAGKRILFLAHRKELISQCYNRFHGYGFDIDLIHQKDNGSTVAISTIQSAVNREFPHFDLIIIDEAHRSKANSYQAIADRYKDSRFLGLTAYPYRMDGLALGRGQGGIYDSFVNPITMAGAISQGYLSPLSYVCPKQQIDTDGLKSSMGEYVNKDLFKRADVQSLYEGAAEVLLEFGQKSTIVFCINQEHAYKTSQTLTQYGFKSASLDSKTPKKDREHVYQQMLSGELDCVCNCQIYVEGIDIPNVDTILLNLKTMSKGKYLQMIGRGTRLSPATGKTKNVVIDMGSNWMKHGYAEADLDIDLNMPLKPKGDAPLKVCPECRAVVPARPMICPNCGYVFEPPKVQEKELLSDDFIEFDMGGKIKEVKRKAVEEISVPKRLRKRYKSMSDGELKEIAALKGYKPGWVWHMKKLRG